MSSAVMSKSSDRHIEVMNAGGEDCTCRGCTERESVMFLDKTGKVLFYFNKNCPIHGIGRYIYPPK